MSACSVLAVAALLPVLAVVAYLALRFARRSPPARRTVGLIVSATLAAVLLETAGLLGLFWYFQTPHFLGDLDDPYLAPALVLLTASAPGSSLESGQGIVLALSDSPADCIAGAGTAELLATLPPEPPAPAATFDCGSFRAASAAELRTALDSRGFQRNPSVLDERAKPCFIDRRCHRVHAEASTEAYLLYDTTRVQTVLVSHGNHTGLEIAFTYAVDAGTTRGRAIGLGGRELAYERNP